MKHPLKNTKGSCNKEEKQEKDNPLKLIKFFESSILLVFQEELKIKKLTI